MLCSPHHPHTTLTNISTLLNREPRAQEKRSSIAVEDQRRSISDNHVRRNSKERSHPLRPPRPNHPHNILPHTSHTHPNETPPCPPHGKEPHRNPRRLRQGRQNGPRQIPRGRLRLGGHPTKNRHPRGYESRSNV